MAPLSDTEFLRIARVAAAVEWTSSSARAYIAARARHGKLQLRVISNVQATMSLQ